MEPGESADAFIVSGRGSLHISILIENMRREGYEFAVGPPTVHLSVFCAMQHNCRPNIQAARNCLGPAQADLLLIWSSLIIARLCGVLHLFCLPQAVRALG